MTGFFEHQDRARRNTRVLVVLMVLGVLTMGGAIYGLIFLLGPWVAPSGIEAFADERILDPRMLGWCVLGTGIVVGLASLGRSLALSGGGAQVAEMMGGRLVSGSPRDGLEKRLVNVVEEMAIASGVPVPQVFVLDDEEGINAFAAGLTLDDAAVAVTRGCLEKLTREELQGVIAHEFSHVLNGDMGLNVRLMGIVFGMVCIALLGRFLLQGSSHRHSRDRRGGGGAIMALGLGLLLIGLVGELFGKLIKAAVSREREFLADASAVQFTRNPGGIAGALKKIGGFSGHSQVRSSQAEEASHFFFGDIRTRLFEGSVLATHPPLAERVQRIDPTFDGEFPRVGPGVAEASDAVVSGLAGVGVASAAVPASGAGAPGDEVGPTSAQAVASQVGTLSVEAIEQSKRLIAAVPPGLREAAQSPFAASALVYALLLSDEEAVRMRQLERIDTLASEQVRAEALRLDPAIRALARRERLSLVELCAPALRGLSALQRGAFGRTVDALVTADERVSIFEYVLGETLRERLAPGESGHAGHRHRTLKSVRAELELLLSLLAHAGATDDVAASHAFTAGARQLESRGLRVELLAASGRLLSALAPALAELRGLPPMHSAEVVDACAHVVIHDRRLTDDEATLLRAICSALRCPLPPFATA